MDNLMFMAFACKEDAINEIVRQGTTDKNEWDRILQSYGWSLNELSCSEITTIENRLGI